MRGNPALFVLDCDPLLGLACRGSYEVGSRERNVMEFTEEPQKRPKYTKPEIKDLGDLRELTAQLANQLFTDVPIGSPVQTSNTP